MFMTIESFAKTWGIHSQGTLKLLNALSDETLSQSVGEGHRDLARMAWHIITTIPEMGKQVGLEIAGIKQNDPVPDNLETIIEGYKSVSESLLNEVRSKWNDDTLFQEDNLYGEVWARGLTLRILVDHEIHHRGQMTVLMRQAGLKVPGIYGPSKEEWTNYGAEPPQV
jgi:uncharacterized damage-inducible protein DinB